MDFKNLCRQAPATEIPQIEGPKADPERVKAELAKLAPLIEKAKIPVNVDNRAWARKILAEHRGGFRRTPTVVMMAKRALGEEL